MTLVEELGSHADACTSVMRSMGISPEGRETYLRLLADPDLQPRPAVAEELAAAHLIAAGSHEPLPLRLATQIWSARREAEAAHVLETAATVSEVIARRSDEPFLEVLQGITAVRDAFAVLHRGVQRMVRALDRPPYLSDGGPEIAPAQAVASARGARHRTIYLASNLDDPRLREIIRASMELGEEARIEHDLPMRMIIGDDDRAMLVLPAGTETDDARRDVRAVVVYPSPLLDGLVRMFESTWRHALPIDAISGRPDAGDEDQRILTMLSTGMTDVRIAHALGISERTVARRVAALQTRLGAPSRFVLGVRAAQEGLV